MKYCEHCGNQMENDNAVVCPNCGEPTKSFNKQNDKNIVINNSASSSATASIPNQKIKKKYNFLLDLILICCTCGLWIIWMLIRPKYEY